MYARKLQTPKDYMIFIHDSFSSKENYSSQKTKTKEY